jgi:hypothetical protein
MQPYDHRPLQHPLEVRWQLTKISFGVVDKAPIPLQKHLFDFRATKKGICGAPMLYQKNFLKTKIPNYNIPQTLFKSLQHPIFHDRWQSTHSVDKAPIPWAKNPFSTWRGWLCRLFLESW